MRSNCSHIHKMIGMSQGPSERWMMKKEEQGRGKEREKRAEKQETLVLATAVPQVS